MKAMIMSRRILKRFFYQKNAIPPLLLMRQARKDDALSIQLYGDVDPFPLLGFNSKFRSEAACPDNMTLAIEGL